MVTSIIGTGRALLVTFLWSTSYVFIKLGLEGINPLAFAACRYALASIILSALMSLKGKKALITGSAAGIGKAIAYRFAEAGAALELADINEDGLKVVKATLARFTVDINIHRLNIAVKRQIDGLWEDLIGREPDILVNNAGVYPFKRFSEVDEEFLRKVMEINLNSVFWMCQHMVKRRSRKGGVIVNIGSIEAILPFERDLVHYGITKAGVIAMTRALAKEHGRAFRVNALLPGGIMTPGTKNVAKGILKFDFGIVKSGVEFKARLPIGRFGNPDEVALMALALASDLTSYVNGALIPVDGGFLST